MSEEKEIPINKYSIFELKAAIDKEISNYFINEDFDEISHYSNIKIFFGFLTCCCTGIAYLFPLPFPQNYFIILFAVIGYVIFSTIYWYIEKWVIDSIFFVGKNEDYFQHLRPKKGSKIKEMIVHSEIDSKNNKRKHIYKLWFDLTLDNSKENVKTDISEINCTEVFDERGYLHKDKVLKMLKNYIKATIPKI